MAMRCGGSDHDLVPQSSGRQRGHQRHQVKSRRLCASALRAGRRTPSQEYRRARVQAEAQCARITPRPSRTRRTWVGSRAARGRPQVDGESALARGLVVRAAR
jgi:hypothetical protein